MELEPVSSFVIVPLKKKTLLGLCKHIVKQCSSSQKLVLSLPDKHVEGDQYPDQNEPDKMGVEYSFT